MVAGRFAQTAGAPRRPGTPVDVQELPDDSLAVSDDKAGAI
jgi:glucose/arabinose dehydrogenase